MLKGSKVKVVQVLDEEYPNYFGYLGKEGTVVQQDPCPADPYQDRMAVVEFPDGKTGAFWLPELEIVE